MRYCKYGFLIIGISSLLGCGVMEPPSVDDPPINDPQDMADGGTSSSDDPDPRAPLIAQTCLTLYESDPTLPSGVYWIDPDGDGDDSDAWQAWCDMERDGGGWTLVLQNNASVGPGENLSWEQATQEVIVRAGSLDDDLGGFDLHVGLAEWGQIGSDARVEVGSAPNEPEHQAFYTLLLDETDDYLLVMLHERILIGGTPPGLYTVHNGQRFSTPDDDNDTLPSSNCASSYGHPWWYGACWQGSLWGGQGHEQAAYWTGSAQYGSPHYAWGALWLR